LSLEKKYIRDFNHRVTGTVTSGFDNGHGSVVRDNSGQVLGRTSTRYNQTRDNSGRIISSNTADAGLLIRKS
jgi:hypothetical protein